MTWIMAAGNRELLSWGGNGSGQLGQGIKEDLFSPRTVPVA